jgi:predicted DNA-binding protein
MPLIRTSEEAHAKLKRLAKESGKDMSKIINEIILQDNTNLLPLNEQFSLFINSWKSFLEGNYEKAKEIVEKMRG